ncbi:katanin p80 WD40 repeat-containing subunit B1 homolog KTN80.4-like isoform X1 [Typha latifolia]|uniref:katanin p80 WD40 repeat-containing subunit B1 homolog KTN80.4-like isoform X1 n=1 Tax=Typha latifolia TaxID=4733 RepID=UPI003C2E7308
MTTTTKRAYKLQEFVAHSSNVNCLKIGRRTSRVLITGGEDHKVNLWAIGKPNAILSLSGHTSAVESVSFDSSEVLVAAGAASGTIKLWDLEEAKIVRTLTGHRSNCISVDFHPFGEFFASGSLDTNLKIWDIRRKGCIHTYKGHTRGVNTIRFTPDGKWVVSGGEDNIVKLWDLTAGKLLHDFKGHEGQIQCIDFHPHEFLLATGSADRTVKLWDLETFELIGSGGPETTGIRSMMFNPDGRTLLCGLHESLKIFSWEPISCHDAVDVGWSRLSDLNIHDGKLLGCSFNQSCVGVWVVDLMRIEPYAMANAARLNGHSESKSTSSGITASQDDSSTKTTNMGRTSVSQNSDSSIKVTMGRLSVSENLDSTAKEMKPVASTGSVPTTPQRGGIGTGAKITTANSAVASSTTTSKRNSSRSNGRTNIQIISKADVVSVVVPRASSRMDLTSDFRKEVCNVVPVIIPRTSSRIELASDSRKEVSEVISEIVPRASIRVEPSTDSRKEAGNVVIVPRSSSRVELASDSRKEAGEVAPVAIPRTSAKVEHVSGSIKEPLVGRTLQYSLQSKFSNFRRSSSIKDDSDTFSRFTGSDDVMNPNHLFVGNGVNQPMTAGKDYADDVKPITSGKLGSNPFAESNTSWHHENYNIRVHKPQDAYSAEVTKGGRTKSPVASWETRDASPTYEGPTTSNSSETTSVSMSYSSRGRAPFGEKGTLSACDEDTVTDLMEQHELFLSLARSRLTKLQAVHQFWKRNELKGAITAMEKMSDHAVSADVTSALMEKSDTITLDICSCLLPLLTGLLESRTERHLGVSLEMLLKLVRIFGPVIHSTLSSGPSVGVDLQAEQRLDRCNLCFIELEKIKHRLSSLTRRKGSIAKSAQELNLALQEVI